MKRNKWKRQADEKLNQALGMKQQTARKRLERMIILHWGRKCGFGNCYQCNQPINSIEDMSIEHIKPWGGNEYGLDADPELFWDLENIALSHKTCNTSCGRSGLGKLGYIGVNYVKDKRRYPEIEYARGAICVNGVAKTLGYFKEPEKAAISYDLALMFYRKGMGKLNFEELRDFYIEVGQTEAFNHRSKQFKNLVDDLYNKLIEILKNENTI